MRGKPVQIAYSLGDPAGIGPEIILQLLSGSWRSHPIKIRIFGSTNVLRECAAVLFHALSIDQHRVLGGCLECETVNVLNQQIEWQPGNPSQEGAQLAWNAIDAAIDSVMTGESDALITGPIHKAQMLKIGFPDPGHTGYLARVSGSQNPVMLYDSPKLKVALATTHIPLSAVPTSLNSEVIEYTVKCVFNYLKDLKITHPRIAVAGLNPHAGSGDNFGPEEENVVIPAIRALHTLDADIIGPAAPDSVFFKAIQGDYDAVVALYHDQGSIAVKTIDFRHTVNVTLGIPFIRTSVDHGTAFDIAGMGKADSGNLAAAIELAARLVLSKQ
ncbi:4-hydroxythreonine-4-phosphate dehydrogenase PdxA [bacterium]|nr:4-hydroxythreonine-4-phosphate dehydrogenase PdxA [candidate division CSSED10-310 bacterium]